MTDQTRQELGHLTRTPSLSGLPRRLLHAPLWLPPRQAAQAQAISWRLSDGWRLDLANPLALSEGVGGRPQHQASGLLRYGDLDVLLAVVHAWLVAGRPESGLVDLSTLDLLRWMGYGDSRDSLVAAPYLALHASLERLRSCQFAVYRDADSSLADDPAGRLALRAPALLAGVVVQRAARPGQPTEIRARLGDEVLAWMMDEAQAIDLDVYAYLARHPASRRVPLARVLYAAMSAWRKIDGSLDLPYGWLAERYGDRRAPSTTGTPGRLIFCDALTQKSRLRTAFEALATTGALPCRRIAVNGLPRIIGHYRVPQDMPRIRDQPRQKRLVELDFAAIAAAHRDGLPEPQPRIAPALPAPAPAPDPAIRDNAALLGRLLTACRVRRSLVDEAKSRGWTDDALARLLVVALFKANRKEVSTPAGWSSSIIRDGSPADWTRDQLPSLGIDAAAVRAWARSPGGPLADTTPKGARHLPANKQETLG